MYPSTFKHETRMLRITKSLAEAGVFDKIYLVASWKDGLAEVEDIDDKRTILRIKTHLGDYEKGGLRKLLNLIDWTIKTYNRFRSIDIRCVNPHCVSALPMAVWFKKTNENCKIVYDAHEIETETSGKSGLMKSISKFIEKKCMPYVDVVNLTSDGHANWYRKEYSLNNVVVTHNYPYRRKESQLKSTVLKEYCGIKDGEILYIHQGLLSPGRGIELTLRAFAKVSSDKHIVFMGLGELEPRIKDYAAQYSNIHFHPAVKSEDVWYYTGSADVGVSIIEPVGLSYQYTLPNKVLESLNAGIPVIVSDFPDMGDLVERHHCGWKVQVNEDSLAALIEQITPQEIEGKSKKAVEWAKYHTWEGEEKILLEMYRECSVKCRNSC